MGSNQSQPQNKEGEQNGATAPTMPEKEKGTDVGPPMVGGRRRKTRSRKARKSRKGKRHSRK